MFGCGHLQDYLGLRKQFATQLINQNIVVNPSQMLTTAGVSHAMELLIKSLCQRGDTILVDDPGWYWVISCTQQMDINVIGIPRDKKGIDPDLFGQCLNHYQPKLYITGAVVDKA